MSKKRDWVELDGTTQRRVNRSLEVAGCDMLSAKIIELKRGSFAQEWLPMCSPRLADAERRTLATVAELDDQSRIAIRPGSLHSLRRVSVRHGGSTGDEPALLISGRRQNHHLHVVKILVNFFYLLLENIALLDKMSACYVSIFVETQMLNTEVFRYAEFDVKNPEV